MPRSRGSSEGVGGDEELRELDDVIRKYEAQRAATDDSDTDSEQDIPDDDDNDESVGPSILDEDSESDVCEEKRSHNVDIGRYRNIMISYRQAVRELQEQNRGLKAQIEQLQAGPNDGRRRCVPWQDQLREHLQGGGPSYDAVYRESCKQENMSPRLDVLHPDFRLRNGEGLEEKPSQPVDEFRSLTRLQLVSQHLVGQGPFPFERLPTDIQVRIFKRLFVRRCLIHCISRLDPSGPPFNFPPTDVAGQSQLPSAFHFGTSPCQINLAKKPNDVLNALLVCKRWFYIGVHAFYGHNTFAFSSLGEWHRFCNGIGIARIERLAHVELTWHGALMPRHETRVSQRTLGLAWLTKARRLRTLTVHIAESVGSRARRKYEKRKRQGNTQHTRTCEDSSVRPGGSRLDESESGGNESDGNQSDVDRKLGRIHDPFKTMAQRTARQPNCRKFRSMRTVQGMDYVYQLRGMNWVRFKERDGLGHRQAIRDWSFLKDVNTVVTMPKEPEQALRSQLRNLTPLTGLRDWLPSDEDLRIIKTFYEETPNLGSTGNSETSDSDDDDSVEGDINYESSDDNHENGSARNSRTPSRPGPPNSHNQVVGILNSSSGSRQTPKQEHDENEMNIYYDVSDASSESLFVRPGQGSPIPPSYQIDIEDISEQADVDAIQSSNLSRSMLAQSDPNSNHIIIDLTGDTDDEDAESSLFVHSDSEPTFVKVEPTDSPGFSEAPGQVIAGVDSGDEDLDDGRIVREETPPDSDDDDHNFPYFNKLKSKPDPPSSGQTSEKDAYSHDDEHTTKRPRLH